MKIGIDVSQTAYTKTGVSNYLLHLVDYLLRIDNQNEYILFFSSLRLQPPAALINILKLYKNVQLKRFRFPPVILDLLWNRLHTMPIDSFIGNVDVFITSDWTEPPVKNAKKVTILYDLIVYKYPEETHQAIEFNWKHLLFSPNIVAVQKRKHEWMKKESSVIFCISEATKKDAIEILGVESKKLNVIYPGL